MNPQKVAIFNGRQYLAGNMYRPDRPVAGGVVFSHGLFSSKDGYKITSLAPAITGAGFALLTFDFSCCGESGSDIQNLSVKREVEDLASAVAFFRGEGFDRPHLVGSSMGAAVTLLYAAEHPGIPLSLVTIAAPVDFRKLFADGAGLSAIESLSDDGTSSIDGIGIKNAFFKEAASIDAVGALGKIRSRTLVIHGALDAVVHPSNAGIISSNIAGPCETLIVPDGDHTLTREDHISIIREKLTEWLTRTNGGMDA